MDLFDQNNNNQLPNLTQIDPNKDYSEELIGDGKRYADVKVAAKSLVEKDNFIERLKQENAQLRQETANRIKMEEFLDKLNSNPKPPVNPNPAETPSQTFGNAPQAEPTAAKGVTPEEVTALIARHEQTQREAKNLETVTQKLKELYGNAYQEVLEKRVQELGASKTFLTEMAKTHPQAFLKLMGSEQPQVNGSLPQSSVNTNGFQTADKKKGFRYYETIRKTKPREYMEPRIQNEMFKQLELLGQEEFYKN